MRYLYTTSQYGVYATGVDENTREILELVMCRTFERVHPACGCYACSQTVQQGHFACSVPNKTLLALEESRQAVRVLDGNEWRWYNVPEEWNKDLAEFPTHVP